MFLNSIKAVFKQIGLLILIYALTRVLFYFFNYAYFSFDAFLSALFYGIRFDLAVIFLLNNVLFFLLFLPLKFISNSFFQRTYQVLFIVVNALALLFNCIDIVISSSFKKDPLSTSLLPWEVKTMVGR